MEDLAATLPMLLMGAWLLPLLSFALIVLSMGLNILVTRDSMQKSGAGPRIDRFCRTFLPAIYFAGLACAYTLR